MKTRKIKLALETAPKSKGMEIPLKLGSAKPLATKKENTPVKSSPVTEVEARVDVGLGNALFIRGQGDGLSWEKGAPLECTAASTWVWSTRQAKDKVVFKLLLNDVLWAQGEDLVVPAGEKLEVAPKF